MTDTILLINHEADHLRRTGARFERLGYEVARELDPASGLAAFDRLRPDVVVVDLPLVSPATGEAITHLLARRAVVVLVVNALDGEPVASWLDAGVDQVVPRGAPPAEDGVDPWLAAAVARAADHARTRRLQLLFHLRDSVTEQGGLDTLGTSARMRDLARQVGALAQSERATVFLTGPRGVGKGWMARLLHDLGPRAGAPFFEVTAAGRTVRELESLLFGHERGAFEGARSRRLGLYELAEGGTLYLRDVDRLPVELQPGILRLLESRTFRRAGGQREQTADTRLLAGSDADLARAVEEERFRGDLYYRLSVVRLPIPPLAEREEVDRLALVNRLYGSIRHSIPGAPPAIAVETFERLLSYPWPGNVREMRLVLERGAILAHGQPTVNVEHLPGEFRARAGLGDRRHTPMSLEELERGHIERTLRYYGGNRTKASKELDISRATLINKVKRYNLTE